MYFLFIKLHFIHAYGWSGYGMNERINEWMELLIPTMQNQFSNKCCRDGKYFL